MLLVLGINAHAAEKRSLSEGYAGLIGIEVGYIGTEMQNSHLPGNIVSGNLLYTEKRDNASLGLKLGGESRHYRAYIDMRVWKDSDYGTSGTIGGAFQYLIPVGEKFNFFLGLNVGGINTVDSEFDLYYGGDAGINFDMTDNLGLEVGVRYSDVDVNAKDIEKADYFYQGYVAVVFKFRGEDY